MKKIFLLVISLGMISGVLTAQNKDKGLFRKKKKPVPVAPKKEEDKFGDIVKKCKKQEGLLVLYRDTTSGKTYVELSLDQIGKSYIYFSHIVDAPVESGYFRGNFGASKIIKIEKNFDKIAFIQDNTNY